MSISTQAQALVFLVCLGVGAALGLLYDLLRLLPLSLPRRWLRAAADLTFWAFVCAALFLCAIFL